MLRKLALAVVVVALAVVGAVVAQRRLGGGAPDAGSSSRLAEIDARVWPFPQAIDEAADYLVRVTGPDGRFEYRRFVDGHPDSTGQYNVLRHAGSIYALADYALSDYRGRPGNEAAPERLHAALGRASSYLVSRYVRPLREHPEILAVWSDPQEERGRAGRPTAKLGGAGLAIVALAGNMRANAAAAPSASASASASADAGAGDLATMQGLGRFILFMQRENGSFHAKYEEPTGYVRDAESLFYPGEAILALTMLYEVDHDARWLEGAARGIAQLIESRRGSTDLPADHWLMIAIDRFVPHHAALAKAPVSREEMVDHAIVLGRLMMSEQADVLATLDDPNVAGAFDADGRTTPAATRLEGLLALEHAIASDPARAAFRTELRGAIGRGLAFLRRSQVQDGVARGGIPWVQRGASFTATAVDASDVADDDGSAARAEQEIRIDYVQHALSAMLRYAVLCRDRGAGCAPGVASTGIAP